MAGSCQSGSPVSAAKAATPSGPSEITTALPPTIGLPSGTSSMTLCQPV
jgi:hypothetical protein